MPTKTRFRRRQLLALCTFLVPLGVLAVLGRNELQRSGGQADAALEREARQFLHRAAQGIDQQFETHLPPLLDGSRRHLADKGPVRTLLALRDHRQYETLLDIVLLDEQLGLVWPELPPAGLDLPFAHDAGSRAADNSITAALQAVDLLLVRGDRAAAQSMLQHLIEQLAAASPPGRVTRRSELENAELQARFRLATVHRTAGELDLARAEFERCSRYATVANRSGRLEQSTAALAVLAEAALAEHGAAGDRVRVLRAIAEGRRDALADGLLAAICDRLARGVPDDDALRPEVDTLLREETQREQARAFASTYDLVLKFGLRIRRLQKTAPAESDADDDARIVSTISGRTTLLHVRRATAEEEETFRCRRVGLHVDLEQLLAPAIEALSAEGSTFALAVDAPDDAPPAPPPGAGGFVPPRLETHGLVLRAVPADAERLLAETRAAARTRTTLMFALFATAAAGAIWLWRSVSREAELAALKVDLVSRVSHELKTPLALIRMYAETLGMGRARDGNQAAQFGGIIVRESERLTALIQRILDFSRQEAGTMRYEAEIVDLGELLRSICDAYTPHLEAKGAILVETLPRRVFVRCDPDACEGAIINLLENAAKYRGEEEHDHEIELELSTAGDRAVIEVRDRGRGVPQAERERIFEGFYRASNAGEVRGAGIGLSLVRHFARAHGGEITAEERPGGGSVFRLVLPIAQPGTAASTPDRDTTASRGTGTPT